ncbi:Zn-ribbon domain-containing OB-fold protein [Mesorhizobium sp. RP14(2022)]|uniref:Zn-ribbon domain-containing OB-fold protein n=1 Tax=Mesorhizobium liriopis TaxID=2953882 RepID=A0ABT1C3F1_9HYPH|nr:Zn-ribbon domain-containing OB-fold protein [Mesorhizobium liriopis]MCO6049345.1 Zn-ribbon domain-containing OB-fold protein [Mesorhizobium liriopis]
MQTSQLKASSIDAEPATTLSGCECLECGRRFVPKRTFCTECGSDNRMKDVRVAGPGKLYSYSVVHIAPKGFKVPYAVGYVDLPGDVRVLGQIMGWEATELQSGMAMDIGHAAIATEADGSVRESFVFLPAANATGKEN